MFVQSYAVRDAAKSLFKYVGNHLDLPVTRFSIMVGMRNGIAVFGDLVLVPPPSRSSFLIFLL